MLRHPLWALMIAELREPLSVPALAERLGERPDLVAAHARLLESMSCIEAAGEHAYRATVRTAMLTEPERITLVVETTGGREWPVPA